MGAKKKPAKKPLNYRESTMKLLLSERKERIAEIMKAERGTGLRGAQIVIEDPTDRFSFDPSYRAPAPEHRRLLRRDLSKGREFYRVPVYCDLKDDALPKPRKFKYITRNEISGFDEPVEDDALVIKCTCTGGCDENCECITFCEKLNNNTMKLEDGALRIGNPVTDIYSHALVVCGPLCSCGPECKRRIKNLMRNFEFEVYRTHRDVGFGVRTRDNIAFGELVMEFVGEVVPTDEILNRELGEDYALEIAGGEELQLMKKAMNLLDGTSKGRRVTAEHVHIDGSERGNLSRFILNGCWPNLQPIRIIENRITPRRHRLFFYALHDIPAGMQLTFFYGKGYMEKRKFECQCRTLLCKHGRWHRFLKTIEPKEVKKVIENILLVWKRLVEEGRMEEEREHQEKIDLVDLTCDVDEPCLSMELEPDSTDSGNKEGDKEVVYEQKTGILDKDEEPVPPALCEEDADLRPQAEPNYDSDDNVELQYRDLSDDDGPSLRRGTGEEDAHLREEDEPEPIEDELRREDHLQKRDLRGHRNNYMEEADIVAGPASKAWERAPKQTENERRVGADELEGAYLNEKRKHSADEVRGVNVEPTPADPALEWNPHSARARLREVMLLPARRAFPGKDPYTLPYFAALRPPVVDAGNFTEPARDEGHLQAVQGSREEFPEYDRLNRTHLISGRRRTREELVDDQLQQEGDRFKKSDAHVVSISHDEEQLQQRSSIRYPSSSGLFLYNEQHQKRPFPQSRQSSRDIPVETVSSDNEEPPSQKSNHRLQEQLDRQTYRSSHRDANCFQDSNRDSFATRGYGKRTVSRGRHEDRWESPDDDQPLSQFSSCPSPEYRPTSPEYRPLEDEDIEEYRPSSPPIHLTPSVESRRIDQFHFDSVTQGGQHQRRGDRGGFEDRHRKRENREWHGDSFTQDGQRQIGGGADRRWNEMENQLHGALPIIRGLQHQLGDEGGGRDEICRWGDRENQFRSGSPTVLQGVPHHHRVQRGRGERRPVEREPYQPPKRRAVDYDYGSSNHRRYSSRREQDELVRRGGGLEDGRQPYVPQSPEILRHPSPEPGEEFHSDWRQNGSINSGYRRMERGEEERRRDDEHRYRRRQNEDHRQYASYSERRGRLDYY